ncbi:MAG: hypothetical protein ACRDDY_03435 [Clostridium sp.]|uniref:hypothetical protein n=1 Tax=Clostridium sp. TaxID=1506 RepID=UPI003EE6B65D
MKKVIFEYLPLKEAEEISKDIEILDTENGYCRILDLFDGESYWLKGVDIEAKNDKKYKRGLDVMVKVSFKDGKTYIDNELITNMRSNFEDGVEALDKVLWRKYLCLVMLNIKIAQDKEFIVSEKELKVSIKPSKYKYNPNKPTIISNISYVKKESQGRHYEKQADNWLVRSHYRVRNGVKYLVKGYEKMFLNK